MATLYLLPNGAGDYTNLLQYPDSGAHWEKVDDAIGSPDDDGTFVYNYNSSDYKKAAFTLQNHTAESGAINWVKVHFRCARFSSGRATPYLRLATTETTGTEITLGASYVSYEEELARPGGGDWSWDDIDALQVAIGLKDFGSTTQPKCTQIYVEVDYTAETPKTSSDSGSGAEVSSLAAAFIQSETGVGTDAQTALLAAIIKADSGVGVEALGDRAIALVEAGVGAEITSLARAVFDSAVGTENSYLKILEGVKTSSDSGSGVEASEMLVSHLRSDTGAATETVVFRALFAREYPAGAIDLAKALVATLSTTDEGTGSEAARQAVAIEASETGSGSDASALVGSLLAHDTAVATEAVTVLAAMVSQDSGVGIEKVLAYFRQCFDAGEGQEIVQLVGLVGRLMKALQYTSAYRQTAIYTAAYRKVRIWTGTREEEHMEVTNVFPRGDVVPIYYNVEDWQGNYIDPSGGCVCSLWQPDGTMATDLADEEIDEEPMTKLDTGQYVYYYYSRDTDPKEFFRSLCTAIDGTGDTTKRTSKSWSFRLQ